MTLQFVIYCDESAKKGPYYSNFFGGLVVRSDHLDEIERRLLDAKDQLGLTGEIKWQKVTAQYLDKYIAFMDTFFDLVQEGKIKVRIMFTQNRWKGPRLKPEHQGKEYFLLYYQFLKHAFGLRFSNPTRKPVGLRCFLDQIPDSQEKAKEFKKFLLKMQYLDEFRAANLSIRWEDIGEATSHEHVLLQALDVVLGSMYFKLNALNEEKLAGHRFRGKRTVAKDRLYKHMNARIRAIYPGFNVGATTGHQGDKANRWHHPYRHWLFVPAGAAIDWDAPTKNK